MRRTVSSSTPSSSPKPTRRPASTPPASSESAPSSKPTPNALSSASSPPAAPPSPPASTPAPPRATSLATTAASPTGSPRPAASTKPPETPSNTTGTPSPGSCRALRTHIVSEELQAEECPGARCLPRNYRLRWKDHALVFWGVASKMSRRCCCEECRCRDGHGRLVRERTRRRRTRDEAGVVVCRRRSDDEEKKAWGSVVFEEAAAAGGDCLGGDVGFVVEVVGDEGRLLGVFADLDGGGFRLGSEDGVVVVVVLGGVLEPGEDVVVEAVVGEVGRFGSAGGAFEKRVGVGRFSLEQGTDE
mmetsp:Transcript_5030/g.15793  ORF Transcript_5030/g.15793 Transcript_5030/m.15793 type:complete len:302 (-) Transcript_5030:396-1301(-)